MPRGSSGAKVFCRAPPNLSDSRLSLGEREPSDRPRPIWGTRRGGLRSPGGAGRAASLRKAKKAKREQQKSGQGQGAEPGQSFGPLPGAGATGAASP